ncbi:MAG TPA: hypothetical protein DIW30_07660 [Bacteroidales bacterium]|nr:hypothetical protein [Bacteroidales bacterium]
MRRMKNTIRCVLLLVSLCFMQCREPATTTTAQRESHYDKGQVMFYGAYYAEEGVEQNVVALDMYSKGLSLDSAGYMVGTGVNLYISDIFLPKQDTFLVETTYVADTTGNEFTFLPGVNYEGQISGVYVLQVTDGALSSAELFSEGSFKVVSKEDSVFIEFLLQNEAGKKYAADFKGKLPYFDGR